MRATEFTVDNRSWYDKWMDQYVFENHSLRETIFLSEIFNNDKVKENLVQNFIALHSHNSEKPAVGNMYSPVGFVLNGPLRRLQLFSCENLVELIQIISSNEYVVNCSGQEHTFPYAFIGNLAAGATFFYNSLPESKLMITSMSYTLLFPEWDIENIVILDSGERKIFAA